MADFESPLAHFAENNAPPIALKMFVVETYIFMRETITEYDEYLEEAMIADLLIAWEELQGSMDRVLGMLKELSPEIIGDHALNGRNLTVKLKLVQVRHEQLLQQRGPIGKLLRKTYEAINTLLKSAVSTLPGGGAIVEFKETIENSINE